LDCQIQAQTQVCLVLPAEPLDLTIQRERVSNYEILQKG